MKKQHNIRPIAKACDCFLSLFLPYILVSQVLYFAPMYSPYKELADEMLGGKLTTSICLIVSVPLFYSLVKFTAMDNELLCKKIVERDNVGMGFKEKLLFLFAQKTFWAGVIAFVVLYLILPLKWCYAALADFFLQNQVTFSGKLLLLICVFPLFFVLGVKAHFSAMEYWYAKSHGQVEENQRQEKKFFTPAEIAVILAVAFYGFIGIVAGICVPLFKGYFRIFQELITPQVIVVLLLLVLFCSGFQYARAFKKRKVFIKRLTVMCGRGQFKLSKIIFPYRSLFSLYDGESFSVRSGEKEYSCKLVSVAKKNVSLVIYEDGICQFVRSTHLLGMEMFKRAKTYKFGWETKSSKVLIINPVPQKVYNSQKFPLDNGDAVGDYKIFTSTAFLNALARGCIDKKV